MSLYGEYENCEIMTRAEMYNREISEPWLRDEDMEEMLFVRWNNDKRAVSYQCLETLCQTIDNLDALFR